MDENEYFVDSILDKKVVDGENFYLIRWYGYPLEDSTWEPEWGLPNIQNLIEEFEENRKNKEKTLKLKGKIPKQSGIKLGKIAPKPITSKNQENLHIDIVIVNPSENDIPERIMSVQRDSRGELEYLVKWQERNNGLTPQPSFVSSEFLKENYPELLILFLESKINFDRLLGNN